MDQTNQLPPELMFRIEETPYAIAKHSFVDLENSDSSTLVDAWTLAFHRAS